jgi:hypothetical protein
MDSVAERPTTLVHDVARDDFERSELMLARLECDHRHAAAQLVGSDREVRWRHRSLEHLERIALRRLRDKNASVGMVDRGTERQSLHMVPVKVGQQDRAVERTGPEDFAQGLQSGARVEDERRELIGESDRDA